MPETSHHNARKTPPSAGGESARPAKKVHSKAVIARAKKIQAARKAAESKIAAAERKARMEQRAANKKKAEEAKARKAAADATKNEKVMRKNNEKKSAETAEIVDFAVTARKYKTQLTRKFKDRKFWVDPSPFEILSYIPGTVISVDVKAGKVVPEGQQLLILEAMKMQNRVDMPFTARVKKINVKVGEKIPKDFVMIELEAVEK